MKRDYRKILIIVMALAMVMSMTAAVFADDAKPQDYSTTLADDTYVLADDAYKLLNEKGKEPANPLTCRQIIVQNGKAEGLFTTTSSAITHVFLGSAKSGEDTALFDPDANTLGSGVYATEEWVEENAVKGRKIVLPVQLNKVVDISVRTTAMSEPKWIHYTYQIKKPTANQDKFDALTYSLGMFSAAATGTEIVLNDDATFTLNVTTKPMTSKKYTKVAMSTDPITDENVETIASQIDVTVDKATDKYVFKDVDYGDKPYYWSMFSFSAPIEAIEEPINACAYNVLKVVDNANKTYEEDLSAAEWAYKSTWTVNNTAELVSALREKAKALGDNEASLRISNVANDLEAKTAIEAAKAKLDDEALLDAALAAIEKLTEAQKAKLSEDIKAIQTAKTNITNAKKAAEKKAKEAAINKVKSGKITAFKAKAGKKKVTFTWKANTLFDGYELKYKVGKKTKTVIIKNAKTAKKVVKKLKKKQKVTAQIRGYKKIDGKTYYGKVAKSKKVKVK